MLHSLQLFVVPVLSLLLGQQAVLEILIEAVEREKAERRRRTRREQERKGKRDGRRREKRELRT